ncbi:DUF5694 domain-containing protein [Pedobacter sandarakinus]|uniref:DUF5694 domain-containing protein n=1 Tax=Pedobacter sandarakinus TaxID=353156 RepID=UPI002246D405|nr:DUF5694 domain-containing protein [Pedobacter sandarakinus]MCX2576082.1 DUF5694 domain-containing protein [Pedobacter sandarakinus]
MKTIQKITLALLMIFSVAVNVNAQNQIEILVVGSNHNNGKSNQNFTLLIDQLKNFKPDMIFGEYLSPSDYHNLPDSNWAKALFKKRLDYINQLNPATSKNLPKQIQRDQKLLSDFAYYHQTRMQLATAYLKNWDRANAEYQIFILEEYMKDKFGKEEKATYAKMFGGIDSLKKNNLFRPNSEYNKVFFPLAYQLKQNIIYPMDNQTYDKPWGIAWGRTDSLYKVMEKKAQADSTSPEAKTLKAIADFTRTSPDDEKQFSENPYGAINDIRYGKLDEVWNLYGGRQFADYPGMPSASIKEMIKYWTLRNEGMCKNIIAQAKAQKAKRIIVGVGGSHKMIMEEILAKNADVKIIKLSELQ